MVLWRLVDDSPSHRPHVNSSWVTRFWPLTVAAVSIPLIAERARLLSRRTPVGADETLYLMQALEWLGRFDKLSDDPARTRGVPALIFPVAAGTDETWAYRLLFAALGIALCWITYLVGREFLERIPAAWAAIVFGLSSAALLGSVALLPDIPAALGVTVAFLLYWRRVAHAPPDRPLRGLWPIAVAIGAVFYFNIAFAALAGITLALDFLIFRRRDLFSRATIAAAAVLGGLLGPYFIKVWIDHNKPWYTIARQLRGSAKLGGPLPGGEPGYVTYARWFFDGDRLFGAFGILVLLGVAILAFALVRGTPVSRRDASLLGLWLTVPTIASALLFHAEVRYMLPWLPAFYLAMALPVAAVSRLVGRPESRRRVASAAAAVLLVAGTTYFGVTQYPIAARRFDNQANSLRLIHAVAQRLGDGPAQPPCQVFTRRPREVELHTGCQTTYYRVTNEDQLIEASNRIPEATFYDWWEGLVGDPRQPSFLTAYFQEHATLEFSIAGKGRLRRGYIYRYLPSR